MDHILDNPIYNALGSGNENFSSGNAGARCFPDDISPLAGLKENSPRDFDALYELSAAGRFFILFTPGEIEVPGHWKVLERMKLLQMVCERLVAGAGRKGEFTTLEERHVQDMLALTKLTNPGPFLPGTIKLGNYIGILSEGRLIAMAGQRLQPGPYIEISAVCTHPDHLGHGYASLLIREQIRRILAASAIPVLHSREDNSSAVRLYQKLGFTTRRRMMAYALQKQGS
ncbi:MAG TPA: GNAT family N-acetyltransferase [Puia sp.]